MKFEVLKKSHLKRNIIIGVVVVAVISAIIINFTRAKYVYTDKMPLINGTVNYSLADLNIVAITVDGESVDTIPEGNYALLDTSYCTIEGVEDESVSLSYDAATQMLTVTPFTTKGTKCYLEFEEKEYTCKGSACEIIMANMDSILTRTDFSTIVTNTTTGTIYKSADESQCDDDGEVYYFAGNPTDNWVSFAGLYWRIIRINGNGSIRLIYQGTSANTTGTGTQITVDGENEFAFNSSYNNNAYVGYMYTSGSVHGLGTSSTIKGVLDNWYLTNIQNAGFLSYIDTNAGFCNDRTPSSGTGTGTTMTNYAADDRLYNMGMPTLGCGDKGNDLFTVSNSTNGNKALTYPVGLITADEVAYAGGLYYQSDGSANNSNYYLYTGQNYWTMSPCDFDGDGADVFLVWSPGSLGANFVHNQYGVRPVINLKADTQFTGTGTSTDPYRVVGA